MKQSCSHFGHPARPNPSQPPRDNEGRRGGGAGLRSLGGPRSSQERRKLQSSCPPQYLRQIVPRRHWDLDLHPRGGSLVVEGSQENVPNASLYTYPHGEGGCSGLSRTQALALGNFPSPTPVLENDSSSVRYGPHLGLLSLSLFGPHLGFLHFPYFPNTLTSKVEGSQERQGSQVLVLQELQGECNVFLVYEPPPCPCRAWSVTERIRSNGF